MPPLEPGKAWVAWLILLLVVIVPIVLANVLASMWRVKEWTTRLWVVFFTLMLGAAPFLSSLLRGENIGDQFRLGIDLAGGTNMVFQIKPEKELTNDLIDEMVKSVKRRVNPSGTEEITVRGVGGGRIEVIIPGADPQTVDETKRQITRLGSLEFFIAADRAEDREIVRAAEELDKATRELIIDGVRRAIWTPADEKKGEPQLLRDGSVVSRKVEKIRDVNGQPERYETEEYLLLVEPPERSVTGRYLKSATTDIDPQGKLIVSFTFDQTGAFLFGDLTTRFERPGRPDNEKRKLAIVLDRRLYSAPNLNEAITGGRGQISGGGTGGFTATEADDLVAVLNAGALEVPIDPKPLSEATVDPTLGADVRNKGVRATLISAAAVVVFMLIYYRLSGLIAVISLMLNLILTLSAMLLINATFTLPGIAGIVLTIGMAVDANVLIYERMREEISKGSSVRMAIQNGFQKAFSTIFDSNVTTLMTAVILFIIGTDQVKGFAVTLIIGLGLSMYTALFVGRLIFDIAERRRWLTSVKMSRIIGDTNYNFLKHQFLWIGISLIVIVAGMFAFFARGTDNYDIDFTGGTMVSFQTTELQKTEDLTAALKTQFGDQFQLERLSIGDEETEEGVGRYFRLRTMESDSHQTSAQGGETSPAADQLTAEDRVRNKIYESFKENDAIKLRMVTVELGPLSTVEIADGDESAEALKALPFKGGPMLTLTFSDEVAEGTLRDMVSARLSAITVDGNAKYGTPEGLFDVKGLEGSGTTAAELAVRKFTKFQVRANPTVTPEDFESSFKAIQSELAATPLFDEVNTFASAVAGEMKQRALLAIIVSILAIAIYIWFRFQNLVFGLAAVVALVHDVLVTLGVTAIASYLTGTSLGNFLLLEDLRINLAMIAAFLTLVGYSLNDTIVVFDRIREVRGKNPAITAGMINTSLNQTLSRTILTSLTVFIVVLIMYVFGGAGIHGFAWCLVVGCVAGTYSSIYIASPILVWAMNRTVGTVKA
ncbi:MAG: protein translocase subunit SecD [Planctomycetaceae bacterium]|nr:protein translocase subunit SecD [Planctomycetaceae bacterium]